MIALLILEGFLLLSGWFQWFAFNRHQGYTVLIAIAAVGVALLLMFLWFLAAVLFRLRFQFSILSLLLLVVVVAIPCSWLETEMKRARIQREVVEEISKAGGEVLCDYEFFGGVDSDLRVVGAVPPEPAWLRHLLGEQFFPNVAEVSLYSPELTDASLRHFGALPNSEC